MLESLERQVRVNLNLGDVDTIWRGNMAVTVTYRDGTEVQLLPALRQGDTVAVPDAESGGWRVSKPRLFRERLTAANNQTGGVLVPAVKVIKAINDGLPKQRRLSGYHIEALAVDSAAGYKGDRSVRDVVLHVLQHSSERVLRPITDVTGQKVSSSTQTSEGLGATETKARGRAAPIYPHSTFNSRNCCPMEGKDFIGALMTVPEGETARQYRLTKQMASMHAALRDRYRRLEVLSGSALIVVSVLFTVTAFSGGQLFSLFDLSVQQGRWVLAGGSVVAFTFSLIVLLFDWPGKKARHGAVPPLGGVGKRVPDPP